MGNRRLGAFGDIAMFSFQMNKNIIKALVERRSSSPDGFPWTHPANEGLARNYGKGALPKSDELFEHSVILPVPSLMDRALEDRYIELFRRAVGT